MAETPNPTDTEADLGLSGLFLDRDPTEPTAPQDFQKSVFRELECPVCLELAVPPITLCKTGHFVCGICRERVQKCGICKEVYTAARSYAIENIVSEIEVKCRHKACQEIRTVSKLQEHLKTCDYRPVICNAKSNTACKNKLIDFDQYVEHLTKVHEVLYFGEPSFNSSRSVPKELAKLLFERQSKTCAWPKSLYVHDGVTFILNMEISEESVMFMWVSAMLTKAEAKNYFADFHIGKKDRDGKIDSRNRNIKWMVGVCSVHNTLQEIKDSEAADYVTFPAHCLMSLSSPGEAEKEGSFKFYTELKLRKVSDEEDHFLVSGEEDLTDDD